MHMGINNTTKYIDCEILAPAGSYQCMVAAFNAGADAVYVGGSMFGARAFADNFNRDELIEAINYAHLRGKRLYLTVNTLLKEDELYNMLYDYIKPLYLAGLDAVIVQDLGVLRYIHECFPDMHIHASTQMTVTGPNFAEELKRLGVSRIVTARELSLAEIKEIYDTTGLEIESFVHGALCYSYSGQCLMSSLIGGRSGNRGRCAQPCRLNYQLLKGDKVINRDNERCLLSPKDMCTLEILPQILECGVYSMKIEGRMKKPEYVAGVVSKYRKYVDLIKSGEPYAVDKADIEELREIYNRGGFSQGYYNTHNSREMMSMYKPNHYGVSVAKINAINGKKISITAIKDINKDDVMEINLNNNSSVGVNAPDYIKKGQKGTLYLEDNFNVSYNRLYEEYVYRTRNNILINKIEQAIIEPKHSVAISGRCVVKKNENMHLTVSADISMCDGFSITVTKESVGVTPEEASSRPLDESELRKRLLKTGNTDFIFKDLKIQLDDGLFVTVGAINELRRDCLEKLRQGIIDVFIREDIQSEKPSEYVNKQNTNNNTTNSHRRMLCFLYTEEQLSVVIEKDWVNSIAIELSRFDYNRAKEVLKYIREHNKKAYVSLPYICRKSAIDEFEQNREFFLDDNNLYDGIVFRNYEEYFYYQSLIKSHNMVCCKKIIFDSNIYNFNSKTNEYMELLSGGCGMDIMSVLPYELNRNEINNMLHENRNAAIDIYGYIPVMTSAGCLLKSTGRCDKSNSGEYLLKDRKNSRMPVVMNCRYCYNTIFNSVPLFLQGDISELGDIGIHSYIIRFTVEDTKNTENILNRIEDELNGVIHDEIKTDFTRGHFRRGVM